MLADILLACRIGLFIYKCIYKLSSRKIKYECWRTIIHRSYSFHFFLGLIQAQESPTLVFVESAGLGDTVTLHCESGNTVSSYLYWYKQSPGFFPEMVALKMFESITSEPHINLTLTEGEEGVCVFHLTIQNVTKGDEANYFCQIYSRDKWNNVTFLSVKGKINLFHGSYSIS